MSKQEQIKNYHKNLRLNAGVVAKIVVPIVLVETLLTGGTNLLFDQQRWPFMPGTRNVEKVLVTTYATDAAPVTEPKTSDMLDSMTDTFAYFGETSPLSEGTPDIVQRRFATGMELPEEFLDHEDKDEIYSRIVNDPDLMKELMESSEQPIQTETVVLNDSSVITTEPAQFVITSHEVDPDNTMRVPMNNDDYSRTIILHLFGNLLIHGIASVILYQNFWWPTDKRDEFRRRNKVPTYKEYRRLRREVKNKK